MPNFTLRVPDDLDSLVAAQAASEGVSKHALILSLIRESLAPDFDPSVVVGFVELTGGELDDTDCPMCEQPLSRPHVGFTAGNRRPLVFGPICIHCANTE